MSNTGRLDCVSCHQVFKHWLEFQLTDNQGKPLGGIPYTLKSWDGIVKANGVTDGQGVLREEDLPPKPMILHVDGQKLAEQLVDKSPTEAVATAKGTGAYHQLVPGEISNATPEVEGWTQEALLASRYYPDPSYPGFIVRPSHNLRHVLEIARIAKPVFAKSCLQPAGCTDAGTVIEPHSNFGQMQIYHTVSKPNGMGTANHSTKNDSEPLILQALAWVGNQVFPRAEANPILIEPYLQMMSQQAVIAGAAANQENNGQETASKTVLSKNERQTLEGIQSSLTRDYQLASASAMALGMMLRNWVNGDDDLYSHEHLKKIADNKGTAETRVRYRFAENAETGQLTAVGYHTSKENMLEPVKVRHVQYNKSLNRYEFWEDGASSPTLVWYQNAASGGLSQQDIDKSVSQDATVNVKVAVLDPQATGQTPGLPIPEEKNWRDGAYINPQQDPSEIGGNSTSTPIPDGRDSGPSKLTTPAPKEKDFRDYILIFPVAGIPPIYVYMNCPYGGTEKGKYSGRSYDPTKAGGSVQDLDWRNIEITQEGIDKVKLHTSRFDESVENQIMIERLEKILSGEIPITDYDRRFYTHETRELERYRALGVPDGANDLITWNNAHTATLEDYKINEKVEPLYTPEAIAIAIERES